MRRACVLFAVAVLAGSLSACSKDRAPSLHGVTYSQRVGEPALNLSSTTGRPLDLRSTCRRRECVLVFLGLEDRAAVAFVHRLARAKSAVESHVILIAVTTDPAHDSLVRLRQAFQRLGVVGVRGDYAMTELAARSLLIDVEPAAAGPPPVGEPQAVLFRSDGTAAVGWPLSLRETALADDLRAVTR